MNLKFINIKFNLADWIIWPLYEKEGNTAYTQYTFKLLFIRILIFLTPKK